jgi:hypothetical protein
MSWERTAVVGTEKWLSRIDPGSTELPRNLSRRLAADVIGPVPSQNGRRFVCLAARIDGDDGPSGLEFSVIILGFMLGNPGTHQGTDELGDAIPGRGVGKDDP